MFYCGTFYEKSGVSEFKKFGATKRVINKSADEYAEIKYDCEENALEIVKGNGIVLLTDAFGIVEKAVVEIIPIQEGMLVNLLEGVIYAKINNKVLRITDDGHGAECKKEEDKIHWVLHTDIERYTEFQLNKTYGVPTDYKYNNKWYNNHSYTKIL